MDNRTQEAIGMAHGFARLDEDGRLAVSVAADLSEARRDAAKAIDAYWGMLTELRDHLGCAGDTGDECEGNGTCGDYGFCVFRDEYTERKALEFYVREAKVAAGEVEAFWGRKPLVEIGEFGVEG